MICVMLTRVVLGHAQQEYSEITGPVFRVQFQPAIVEELAEDDYTTVIMNLTAPNGTDTSYTLNITSDDTDIVVLSEGATLDLPAADPGALVPGNFTLRGKRLGRTTLSFQFTNEDTDHVDQEYPGQYEVSVVRTDRIEDDIFNYALGLIIVINNVGFGCRFEWKVARHVFSRPLAAIIGVTGQYVILPLVSMQGLSHAECLDRDPRTLEVKVFANVSLKIQLFS